MRIKELILDGFKSCQSHTVIKDFDPQFNAITGMNGSGKSNIFDSIVFLMGITTMSHMRVHNLQELIYKEGKAGIHKCTVTIVFDNSDKDRSPNGYHDLDSIYVSRTVSIFSYRVDRKIRAYSNFPLQNSREGRNVGTCPRLLQIDLIECQ